jgi:hypothetical protein
MARLERIDVDIEKTRARIVALQSKLRELDDQRTEQENIGIIGAVRALKMTREELAAFIKDGRLPASLYDAAAVPAMRYSHKRQAADTAEAMTDYTTTTNEAEDESEGEGNEE